MDHFVKVVDKHNQVHLFSVRHIMAVDFEVNDQVRIVHRDNQRTIVTLNQEEKMRLIRALQTM